MEIRLILGDQLNYNHSWFREKNDSVVYAMMEIRPESEYVTHHIQKIVSIFLSMRNFASSLSESGHKVEYFRISDSSNLHSFFENLNVLKKKYKAEKLVYMEPDEYRLDIQFKEEFKSLGIPVEMISSEHFLTGRTELKEVFKGRKKWVMEYFYRYMRKKHNILMNTLDEPEGGEWNYDSQNRKKLPDSIIPPQPLLFDHDVEDIIMEIEDAGLTYIGSIDSNRLEWPVSRSESLALLDYFTENLLSHFGDFQDALPNEHKYLYHSRLSFSMNVKMLHPKEVIAKVIGYWKENSDQIDISQVEGFIRQILGWREYMRGMYWCRMPDFSVENFLEHKRKLPGYFWTGKTKMNCLQKAISQSLTTGYAHHIQRLMVTGNFALLAGIDPDEVDNWYLGIYVDAFEWVEMPNARGMSQYADGGRIATKPYVSSAGYIKKMGNLCNHCHYNHKEKTGDKSCPFNSLYWHFLDKNRGKLQGNHRMSMMYRLLDKLDNKEELISQANTYLKDIEKL